MMLARLASMSLRARNVVEGFLAGRHQSPYKGVSLDFAEHRQYVPGDELKRLDWKVFGRTDRWYIKQYEDETNLRCYLVVDTSASMGYASAGNLTKLEYASYLTAALAYLIIRQRDRAGLVTFSSQVDGHIPPAGTQEHLKTILDKLDSITPAGTTDIRVSLTEFGRIIKRRGLIVFISDLFDDPGAVLRVLANFTFRRNEVILFHLLDPAETDLPFSGTLQFEGMELRDRLTVQPELIRKSYRHIISDFVEQYKQSCRMAGIDYVLLTTDVPLEEGLTQYLFRRRRIKNR